MVTDTGIYGTRVWKYSIDFREFVINYSIQDDDIVEVDVDDNASLS